MGIHKHSNMSDGGSNQRLPYNQSQRSGQPQHRQQQQQQGQPPHQHTAAAQQMGGYMMHQQPAWGGGGGVQQAQYGQAQQQAQSMYQQQLYQQHMQQQQMQQQQQQQQQPDYGGGVPPAAAATAAGLHPQYQQALMANAYMNQQQAVPLVQPMQVIQPRPGRLPADRPIMKLSVGLIETYKEINKVRDGKEMCVCFAFCLLFRLLLFSGTALRLEQLVVLKATANLQEHAP